MDKEKYIRTTMNPNVRHLLFALLTIVFSCSSLNHWTPVATWYYEISNTPDGTRYGHMIITEQPKKRLKVVMKATDGDEEVEVKDLVFVHRKMTGFMELPNLTLTITGLFEGYEFVGTIDAGEKGSFPIQATRMME